MQNHRYFKTNPTDSKQFKIECYTLIEDSQKLSPKSKEFINSVCRRLLKPSNPQEQMMQKPQNFSGIPVGLNKSPSNFPNQNANPQNFKF